ncbi:uncharacterized protein CEXT_519821 [Caerostris extrusa]|uniref:Gustatory receptor n=1 Tax=Caerostris extrusa TaxID=172846 RepID=A0AAV4W1L4_CAEEX|nr:uncharacterized protein CEXT_519821 [Caerostris extrusa]
MIAQAPFTIHFHNQKVKDYEFDDTSNRHIPSNVETERGISLLKRIFTFFSINLSTKVSPSSTCLQLLQLITLTNMYIAYLILIDIRSYFMMNTSLGLSISLSSGTIIIVALRLILLTHLKLIRQSVRMSYDLLCTIHKGRCPSIMPCIFFQFRNLYCNNKTNRTAMVLFYILASFLECMDMITMYTFPGMVLILCTYQFSIISELNKALARRIKDSYSMKEAIEEYLAFYAEVQLVMKISERAISPIVFLCTPTF